MKAPMLIALLLLTGSAGFCQTIKQRQPANGMSCRDLFITSSLALPGFYQRQQFDSIQYYNSMRERDCGPDIDIYSIRLLLAIEQGSFTKDMLAGVDFYNMLDDYADVVHKLNGNNRDSYHSSRYFHASLYDNNIFFTTTGWAKHLLDTRQLDSLESFVCHVLAGDIRHPNAVVKKEPARYATMDSLLKKNGFMNRAGRAVNCSFGAGIWIPNGKLSTLGVHPSISFPVVGIRNKLNQLDLAFSFRFLRAANDYTILRQGNLYDRNYFLSGYIGTEYTRYLIHSYHFESGIIAGLGYDGLDIATGSEYYHDNDNLKPLDINSFNANLGIRANYFFTPNCYIGIATKYNIINYCNTGGTPLDGNALSAEVMIGINGSWRNAGY
ncbi:MAG TPA: hypothetical protein VGM41_09355 [Chitinophagaceae bacterium]|jgi:hypothetical protein